MNWAPPQARLAAMKLQAIADVRAGIKDNRVSNRVR